MPDDPHASGSRHEVEMPLPTAAPLVLAMGLVLLDPPLGSGYGTSIVCCCSAAPARRATVRSSS